MHIDASSAYGTNGKDDIGNMIPLAPGSIYAGAKISKKTIPAFKVTRGDEKLK